PVGDKLYFYSETTGGSSSQLYVLDSLTEEFGPVVLEGGLTLRAIDPAFATHDGILYIFSQSPGEQGVKLRIIDSVTGQVDTIEPEPGPSSSNLSLFATMEVVGDRLYLPTNNGLEILDTITRTITTVPTFMGTGPLMRAGNQLYIKSQLEGGVAGLSRFDTVTGEVDAVLLANGTAGSRPNRFIQ